MIQGGLSILTAEINNHLSNIEENIHTSGQRPSLEHCFIPIFRTILWFIVPER